MILAVTFKEVFTRVAPSYSRAHWPEHTDEMEVHWVTVSMGGNILTYEYTDGTQGFDFMSDIKSYTTRSK